MGETEPQFTFYKVGLDGTARTAMSYYDGPKNAILVLGIPRNHQGNHVRIAYATMGGSIYHAHLEPVASPGGLYASVKGELSSIPNRTNGSRKHLLSIYVLPDEDQRRMAAIGLDHSDSFESLPEGVLEALQRKLGATHHCFVEDTRGRRAIDAARAQELENAPKSGLARLLWHHSRYTSE